MTNIIFEVQKWRKHIYVISNSYKNHITLFQFLIKVYISLTDLKDFLRFATGSIALPSGNIEVVFDVEDGCIFASTCLMELHFPPKFDSYTTFQMAAMAVIAKHGKSFNAL